MATVNIDIGGIFERYGSAFGFVPPTLNPKFASASFNKVAARFLKFPTYTNQDASFAEMIFENNVSGEIYSFGHEQIEKGTPALPFQTVKVGNSRFLAPPPMVSFTREKHVVKTPIDRSNNIVIENFGNKEYNLKLQGILIDVEDHHYPGDLLKSVHEMFEADGTYKAVGDIFDDLNIVEIFFESGFNIGFVEGYVDTIKFSVNAISVQAAEFIIK